MYICIHVYMYTCICVYIVYSYNLNICSCMFEWSYLANFQQTYFILRHISSIQFLRGQMLILLISQWSSRPTADHAEAPVATPAKTQLLGGATVTLEHFFRLCAEIRRLKPTKTWMTIKVGWLTFNRQTNSENYHVNMLMKLCNRGFSWFSNRKANEPKVGSGSQFFPTWGEE